MKQQGEEQTVSLHFSYSQLNTYLLCPMKYAHQYVYGTPWESRPAALCFGKAIHKSAEAYYRNIQENGEIIPVDQMIHTFETVFFDDIGNNDIPLTMKDGETSESLREQGINLLKLFHAETRPRKIRAVEMPFTQKIPDIINKKGDLSVILKGVFDLVEADDDGTYSVVELKTSAQRYSSLKLEYDLQATVYSYAMTSMRVGTSSKSCLVRFDVLIKTKKPTFDHYYVTRSEADFQRLIHLINYILKAIENRIFYRQTGWQCGDCQFKKACFTI